MKEIIFYNPPNKPGFWRFGIYFQKPIQLPPREAGTRVQENLKRFFSKLAIPLSRRYGGTYGLFRDPKKELSFLLPKQVKDKKIQDGKVVASAPFEIGAVIFLYTRAGDIRGIESFLVIPQGVESEPIFAVKLDTKGKIIAVKKTSSSPWREYKETEGVGALITLGIAIKVGIAVVGAVVAAFTAYFLIKQLFHVDKIISKFSDGFAEGAKKGGKFAGIATSATLGVFPILLLFGFALSLKDKTRSSK